VGLRYRHLGLIAALTVVVSLALPAMAAAADDPTPTPEPSPAIVDDGTDIVFEAVLTVRYIDAATLLPVEAAAVHVVAHSGDLEVGAYDGTTDADGVAVFDGLPIERGFGPEVTLDVSATKETSFEDPETGCHGADSWSAQRLAVPVDGDAISVDFAMSEQVTSSSLSCPEPTPTGAVGGIVGTPGVTPPPTDAATAPADTSSRGGLVVVGLLLGLAGLVLAAVRPRMGRR
jgi:hypothetical protein